MIKEYTMIRHWLCEGSPFSFFIFQNNTGPSEIGVRTGFHVALFPTDQKSVFALGFHVAMLPAAHSTVHLVCYLDDKLFQPLPW